tara:strand:+ start:229 stop:621 length:393 start_codon:yes stop_codon:yes gene_type:complete
MRLKLSFTVEEEDIYKEAAMILAMATSDLKHGISMYENIQKELLTQDGAGDIEKALAMMSDLRKALLKVDVRTVEVDDIITTYREHLESTKEENLVAQNLREMPQPPSMPAYEELETLEDPAEAPTDENL